MNIITISDHRPVYSLFECDVKKINIEKRNQVYQTLLKEADRKQIESIPQINVNKSELNFGNDLLFYDMKQQKIILTNLGTSRNNLYIAFENQASNSLGVSGARTSLNLTKSTSMNPSCWVKIHPQYEERVEPGRSYAVDLKTCFNPFILTELNHKRKLESRLIVKCLGGKDVVVSIKCSYRPTVIGFSLKCLSQIKDCFDKDSFEDILKVENDIDRLESDFDEKLKILLKQNTVQTQTQLVVKKRIAKVASASSISNLRSKIEVYNLALRDLKQIIVDKDTFFNNELSADYK